MIRGIMGNHNWARLVFWLILLSGFLVTTLEDNLGKDEIFLSQFMAPSTGKVNEQMVKICLFFCLSSSFDSFNIIIKLSCVVGV